MESLCEVISSGGHVLQQRKGPQPTGGFPELRLPQGSAETAQGYSSLLKSGVLPSVLDGARSNGSHPSVLHKQPLGSVSDQEHGCLHSSVSREDALWRGHPLREGTLWGGYPTREGTLWGGPSHGPNGRHQVYLNPTPRSAQANGTHLSWSLRQNSGHSSQGRGCSSGWAVCIVCPSGGWCHHPDRRTAEGWGCHADCRLMKVPNKLQETRQSEGHVALGRLRRNWAPGSYTVCRGPTVHGQTPQNSLTTTHRREGGW